MDLMACDNGLNRNVAKAQPKANHKEHKVFTKGKEESRLKSLK